MKGAIIMSALPPGWEKNQLAAVKSDLPLATQVFPVADMLMKDLRGTLKMIKEAGYDGAEFFGGLRWPAQEVRYALDESGLEIAGWHTPWHYLAPAHINSTITYNKVLRNQYIVVPWMPDETLATRESCLQFSEGLTWVSDVLARHDMVTGYHNHATEFRRTDDTKELPWDIIAQNTPSTVIMQNDIGNGMQGGGDMMGLLKKYPGRGATVHMKPFSSQSRNTFFDDPNCEIDWDEYFKICRNEVGVRWYIVEYLNNERYPNDPMRGMAESAKWFRSRGGK
jgi:sugar phosphate isomerase/epimerase